MLRVEAHVGGMGIDESKLGSGSDAVRLAEFFQAGLRERWLFRYCRRSCPRSISSQVLKTACRLRGWT